MDAELCPRTITEESEPLSVDSFAKCDSCSSEYDSRNGDCPVCLMLGRGVVPEQPTPNLTSIPTPVETLDKMLENFKNEHRDLEETIKTKDKEPIKDVVISDEVRERLRKELGIGDGSK